MTRPLLTHKAERFFAGGKSVAKKAAKSKRNEFNFDEHIELDEINKASERFRGLSDATEFVFPAG